MINDKHKKKTELTYEGINKNYKEKFENKLSKLKVKTDKNKNKKEENKVILLYNRKIFIKLTIEEKV